MGIVYIQLNGAKQILYSVVLDIRAIDEVFVLASCYNLKIITNIKSSAITLHTIQFIFTICFICGFH